MLTVRHSRAVELLATRIWDYFAGQIQWLEQIAERPHPAGNPGGGRLLVGLVEFAGSDAGGERGPLGCDESQRGPGGVLAVPLLTASAELTAARRVLRQIIALVDDAPVLPDDQLRARLVGLATVARSRCRREALRWMRRQPCMTTETMGGT